MCDTIVEVGPDRVRRRGMLSAFVFDDTVCGMAATKALFDET